MDSSHNSKKPLAAKASESTDLTKIRLTLSYDGTHFQGWQKQPGLSTVQGTLESVLSQIYNEPIKVIASGRTDAGAHAIAQVAHFQAPIAPAREERLIRALNALLPDGIVVKAAFKAPDDFHALFSARRKTYIYRIWNHPIRSALWNQRALWVPTPLDLKALNRLSARLIGRKDFKSFQSTGSEVKTSIRKIEMAQWRQVSPHLIEFRIRGNGFLKQMVRNIVGTCLYLEKTKGTAHHMEAIINAKNRQAAKATAAAHGLYLYRVEYPRSLDNKCLKL